MGGIGRMGFTICVALASILSAQTTAEFDAVSIKRNNAGPNAGGGMQSLPDGTYVVKNQPISSIIRFASPVFVREVAGLPTWAKEDRYDVIAKPPAGTTPQQLAQMWRTMFAQRMKLVAHLEDREIDVYALRLARPDGRLGPKLKRAAPECTPRPAEPPASQEKPRPEPPSRCGASLGDTRIEAGGTTMDILVQWLGNAAGRLVNNRTGLTGFYELRLDFAPELSPGAQPTSGDAPPDVFTAVREQLGLKLEPEKARAPVFVIDSIQRPSEN
jgi:uncharacterized protein (TIGR03435 family)